MENEIKMNILNVQRIVKKDTGDILTKLDYMVALEQTEYFSGYSVMTVWCDTDCFDKIKPFIGKEVVSKIGIRKGKNGNMSPYIKSINNVNI